MIYDILTLFPEAFDSFKSTSLIGKAVENQRIKIRIHNIRDYTIDKHKKVDDIPFGGGAGMIMACQPLFDSVEAVQKLETEPAPVLFFTPHGETLSQPHFENYAVSETKRVIIICGHYEGIDQRVRDELITHEYSLGNFVLTGGELPAEVFIDGVSRLIPGVIGKEESHLEESHSERLGRNMVEYPHYTRPQDFKGLKVPDILLSGNHAKIAAWREENCQKKDSGS